MSPVDWFLRGHQPPFKFATLMLLLATLGWGFGFAWAKSAQNGLNQQLGLTAEAAFGPLLAASIRYSFAGLIVLLTNSGARRGWSIASLQRVLLIGGLFGIALGMQQLGLSRTSEAVSAFLTSLSVVFVPLLMMVAMRSAPPPLLSTALIIATAGIWLMTGATLTGFGVGETLGVICAIVFSIYMITLNVQVPRDSRWRMIAGQFLVSGLLLMLTCIFIDHGHRSISINVLLDLPRRREIWLNSLLSMLFPTLLSFILMNLYQPQVDARRAALIYLMEPVFAAAYAFVVQGRSLRWVELCGAGLILSANLLVEWLNTQHRHQGSVSATHPQEALP